MPKVSVIVPCYNVAPYLERCLDSLVQQTLKDIEIICIDDKSTDNTLNILHNYATKDSRIKIIEHTKNTGVAIARNEGLNQAQGEYIGFIDPDDYVPDNNVLNDLYNSAIINQVKVCGGSIIFCDMKNSLLPYEQSKSNTFNEDTLTQYKDWPYDYGFTRFIYNRDFLIKNNIFFPKYIRQEDPVFFVNVMSLAKIFYAIRRPTYVYRVNYKEIKWSSQTLVDVFKGIKDCLSIAKENNFLDLYLNIAKHINDFAAPAKAFFQDSNVCNTIISVIKNIIENTPNDFYPSKIFLKILKKYDKKFYLKYIKQKVNHKRIYLLGFLPTIQIVKYRFFTDVKLFDFLTLMRIYSDCRSTKYFLFALLPIIKIKG